MFKTRNNNNNSRVLGTAFISHKKRQRKSKDPDKNPYTLRGGRCTDNDNAASKRKSGFLNSN